MTTAETMIWISVSVHRNGPMVRGAPWGTW